MSGARSSRDVIRMRAKSLGRSRAGWAYFGAYAACVPTANWLVEHVGTVCAPDGPCLIPVGPGGLLAPSGVLLIGLALILRNLVQRRLGVGWGIAAIAFGAALSAITARPSLVVASVAAFSVSETADLAVYTPLRRRGLVLPVLASSLVGLLLDSVLFLLIAFGNLDHLAGQIVGKLWAVLLTVPVLAWLERRAAYRALARSEDPM